MPMSERLLTPKTHEPAQPALTKMKMNRKNGFLNLSKESWWKSRGMPEELQNSCESFKRSIQMYKEHITAPNLPQPAPHTHLNDLQKQGFSANQERNSYQPYAIKLQNKLNFSIHPTNPQADIVAIGRCEFWITGVDLMKHQGNDTESPSDDPILPEVYTATIACIYNIDEQCQGMITPERFNILQRALFWKGKIQRLTRIKPIYPSELVGLVTCKDIATTKYTSQKIKNSFSQMLPSYIFTILQKWALVTKEKMASPGAPLTMTPHSLNTGMNTQEIRPSGQTATPSPPSSLVSLFAIPFTIKTPCIQQQGMQFTLLPLAQRHWLPSCFFPHGIKGWAQVSAYRSTANSRTCANSWAAYHQTNSNMQKYPFGTIYRRPFPNTPGKCISLLYGILKLETASMLATKIGQLILPKKIPRQSGKSIAS